MFFSPRKAGYKLQIYPPRWFPFSSDLNRFFMWTVNLLFDFGLGKVTGWFRGPKPKSVNYNGIVWSLDSLH